jgi:hypothetical protein
MCTGNYSNVQQNYFSAKWERKAKKVFNFNIYFVSAVVKCVKLNSICGPTAALLPPTETHFPELRQPN